MCPNPERKVDIQPQIPEEKPKARPDLTDEQILEIAVGAPETAKDRIRARKKAKKKAAKEEGRSTSTLVDESEKVEMLPTTTTEEPKEEDLFGKITEENAREIELRDAEYRKSLEEKDKKEGKTERKKRISKKKAEEQARKREERQAQSEKSRGITDLDKAMQEKSLEADREYKKTLKKIRSGEAIIPKTEEVTDLRPEEVKQISVDDISDRIKRIGLSSAKSKGNEWVTNKLQDVFQQERGEDLTEDEESMIRKNVIEILDLPPETLKSTTPIEADGDKAWELSPGSKLAKESELDILSEEKKEIQDAKEEEKGYWSRRAAQVEGATKLPEYIMEDLAQVGSKKEDLVEHFLKFDELVNSDLLSYLGPENQWIDQSDVQKLARIKIDKLYDELAVLGWTKILEKRKKKKEIKRLFELSNA